MFIEIEDLCKKAAAHSTMASSAKDALAYSQAALNLAHVIATLKGCNQLEMQDRAKMSEMEESVKQPSDPLTDPNLMTLDNSLGFDPDDEFTGPA